MRGKPAPKRTIAPDTKYNNLIVGKFINYIMRNGKKSVAEQIVYDAFDIVAKKEKKEALITFEEALKNVSPNVEVRGKRIGGANYQIPVTVRGGRQQALAFRWLIDSARLKKGKKMAEKLAGEIIEASHNEGAAIKKRADVQRMAEANKAFAHLARTV
jgi:small subunit ribosomal protein S7